MLLEERKIVCEANKALKEQKLVKWTSGNVSLRLPELNYVIIKPSGVHFEELTAEKMVIVDLLGNVVFGKLKPSVDLSSHLYVYNNNDKTNCIVHTHSPFATSFAILGEDIPVLTTTHANVFGSPIPVSKYASIGEEDIGKQIINNIDSSDVVLLRNHGVFVCSQNIKDCIKKSVVLEEIAEYSYYALLRNPNLDQLPEKVINDTNYFYKSKYGQ